MERASQLRLRYLKSARFQRVFLITIACVGLFSTLFASYQVYQNNKIDGFGNGDIRVESCQLINEPYKIYDCRGDYTSTSGGGWMYSTTITVAGTFYNEGELIHDVYPAGNQPHPATHFITGKERSSVIYNLQWIFLFFSGVILIALALGICLRQRRTNT